MDPVTLIAFTIAYAVAIIVPGPGVAAIVARALGSGFAGTLPLILGILVGDLIFLGVAAFGLAAIAAMFSGVFTLIRICGALYLLYIAYKFWTAKPGAEQISPKATESSWKTFLGGISLTLGNPKAIVFFLALMPTVVPLEEMTLLALAEMVGIIAVVLVSICSAYAFLAARARDFFRSPVALRRLNRTAAGIMTAAAVGVIWR